MSVGAFDYSPTLWRHSNGQWCKKIAHQVVYFGRDYEAALLEYKRCLVDPLFWLGPKTLPIVRPCVYFLLRESRIVYVGKTSNLYARLAQHRKDKRFDEVRYLEPIDASRLEPMETAFIVWLKPEYNIAGANEVLTKDQVDQLVWCGVPRDLVERLSEFGDGVEYPMPPTGQLRLFG